MSALTNWFVVLFFAGNVIVFVIAVGILSWALGGLRRYNSRRIAEAARRHTPAPPLAVRQHAEHA